MTVHYCLLNSALLSLYMEYECICFMRVTSEILPQCSAFACVGFIDFTEHNISSTILLLEADFSLHSDKAAGWTSNRPGFDFRHRRETFLFSKRPDLLYDHSSLLSTGYWNILLGEKAAGMQV